MKKIFTILAIVTISGAAFGQAPTTGIDKELNLLPRDAKPASKDMVYKDRYLSGTRDGALTYYWVNYSLGVDLAFNGLALENISAMPLWPDSTVKVVGNDGTGPFEYFWWVHSFATTLDPTSFYFHDYVDYEYYPDIPPAVPTPLWFDAKHAFDVDSVGIYYYYDRYNTDVTDTLEVYLITPSSSALVFGTLGDPPYQAVYTRYIDDFNRPNGTFQKQTVLLGDADTASFGIGYIQLPVDIEIPKSPTGNANKIGIAFSYKPGQSYSFGDTLLDFNDPPTVTNPMNVFWLLTNEELLESLPTAYGDGSYNQSGAATSDVRYNISTTGWNGYYINTTAFLSPEYAWEHAFVDWHMAPKGAAFAFQNVSPCVDLTMEFFDLSNFMDDPASASYYWIFGDGSIDFDQNPTHTFPSPGSYEVCVVVTEGAVSYETCRTINVDFCTSLDEFSSLNDFSLYPNPANNLINLNVSFNTSEDIMVSIVNNQGQVVYRNNPGQVTTFNDAINVEQLAAGLYMMHIQNAAGQAVTRSFVVE